MCNDNFDELINMNSEINKIMLIALARGDRYLPDKNEEREKAEGNNFQSYLNNYFYKKENAAELNKVINIIICLIVSFQF